MLLMHSILKTKLSPAKLNLKVCQFLFELTASFVYISRFMHFMSSSWLFKDPIVAWKIVLLGLSIIFERIQRLSQSTPEMEILRHKIPRNWWKIVKKIKLCVNINYYTFFSLTSSSRFCMLISICVFNEFLKKH